MFHGQEQKDDLSLVGAAVHASTAPLPCDETVLAQHAAIDLSTTYPQQSSLGHSIPAYTFPATARPSQANTFTDSPASRSTAHSDPKQNYCHHAR